MRIAAASTCARGCFAQVDVSERRILLTEPPMNPRANRERMFEVMFETFGFQGMHLQVQAVLSLYSEGALLHS